PAPDTAGGAFIAGATRGDLGGPSAGVNDAWLGRLDRAGNRAWLLQLGTAAEDLAYAAAPDGAGGVFVGGSTRGSLAAPNQGEEDIWLARYTPSGERLWLIQFGTAASEAAFALA